MPLWINRVFNVRRWNIWHWEIADVRELDGELAFVYFFMGTVVTYVMGLLVIGLPLVGLGFSDAAIFVGPLALNLFQLTLPFWGHKVSVFQNVPDSYYDTSPLKYARKYYDLPSKDKANFPSNILDTLRNPHVSDGQKERIAMEMRDTFNAMTRREEARNALLVRHVDIDHVLESIKEQRKAVESDTETYREYA